VKEIAEKLLELAAKYKIAQIKSIDFKHDSVIVGCEKGLYRFFQAEARGKPVEAERYLDVPLFYWRSKRRYLELRSVLHKGIVKRPAGMRIKHFCAGGSLAALCVRQMDLLEFILQDEITTVFSSLDLKNQYGNMLLSTANGVKASVELGVLPNVAESIELHEIICETGVVSDQVVDTQVEHYPIYVFGKDKREVYQDLDYELYGIEIDDGERIRYILAVLADSSQIGILQRQHAHYLKLRQAIDESNSLVAPLALYGGKPR
jgi:hypothetical protein